MKTRHIFALAAAALALGAASEPRPASEIVVTGTREGRRDIAQFVRDVTDDSGRQIARFHRDICVAAFGLPPAQAEAVEQRMSDVAEAAGLNLARPGCRPNLVVVVADSSRDFLEAFRKRQPRLFHDIKGPDRAALFGGEGPVRAWQIVERHEADGRRAEHFIEGVGYRPEAHLMPHVHSSRLRHSTRPDLALSFVVFDLDEIEGLTLTQIADYAAMRALARTRPEGAEGPPTILRLFDGGTSRALSRWDLAYLKALYATDNAMMAGQQRQAMSRRVAAELAAQQAPRR